VKAQKIIFITLFFFVFSMVRANYQQDLERSIYDVRKVFFLQILEEGKYNELQSNLSMCQRQEIQDFIIGRRNFREGILFNAIMKEDRTAILICLAFLAIYDDLDILANKKNALGSTLLDIAKQRSIQETGSVARILDASLFPHTP
jgi:hypothetical protein